MNKIYLKKKETSLKSILVQKFALFLLCLNDSAKYKP